MLPVLSELFELRPFSKSASPDIRPDTVLFFVSSKPGIIFFSQLSAGGGHLNNEYVMFSVVIYVV